MVEGRASRRSPGQPRNVNREYQHCEYEERRTLATRISSGCAQLIYAESGINLGADKKTMLEIRLKRRLRSLGMSVARRLLRTTCFGPKGREDELVHLIDVVTTNKTDFFREAGHFDYLVSKALPDLAARYGAQPEVAGLERRLLHRRGALYAGDGPQRVCRGPRPGFRFSVLATDISTEVLAKARMGIFKSELVRPVPRSLAAKVLHAQPRSGIRICFAWFPELRALVDFRRINFMDADFDLRRGAGNHLLPERHHLLRPPHPGAAF